MPLSCMNDSLPHVINRRDLNTVTKLDYIRAVKCLQNTRAENRTLARKFTRYDQFVITHSNVADQVHGVVRIECCSSGERLAYDISAIGTILAVAQALSPDLRERITHGVWIQGRYPVRGLVENMNKSLIIPTSTKVLGLEPRCRL